MQIATDVATLDEQRERAGLRGTQLVAAVADLGRDPLERERLVDVLLRAPDRWLAVRAIQTGETERPSAAFGSRVELVDVRVAAGQIKERRSRDRRLRDPDANLCAVDQNVQATPASMEAPRYQSAVNDGVKYL